MLHEAILVNGQGEVSKCEKTELTKLIQWDKPSAYADKLAQTVTHSTIYLLDFSYRITITLLLKS